MFFVCTEGIYVAFVTITAFYIIIVCPIKMKYLRSIEME